MMAMMMRVTLVMISGSGGDDLYGDFETKDLSIGTTTNCSESGAWRASIGVLASTCARVGCFSSAECGYQSLGAISGGGTKCAKGSGTRSSVRANWRYESAAVGGIIARAKGGLYNSLTSLQHLEFPWGRVFGGSDGARGGRLTAALISPRKRKRGVNSWG